MRTLKNSLLATVGVVISTFTLVIPNLGHAAVQRTMNANIVNTPTVEVVNPANNPALVRDVDKNERLAVHVDEDVDVIIPAATVSVDGITTPGVEKISVVTIPAGLRGVIKQATARVRGVIVDPGGAKTAILPSITSTAPNLPRVVTVAIETELLNPPPGFAMSVRHFQTTPDNVPFAATFQEELFADPGTEVVIVLENFHTAPVRVVADFSASAFAVVCLPGPLQGTCPPPGP